MQVVDIKKRAIKSSAWSLLDNICSLGLAFIIGVVLARLLSPSDYGTVGVLSIFLLIANVFVDSGFGNALIRKRDRTQNDLSTAFFFNLLVGIIIYAILYVISPYIASFFSMPILETLLRVLAFCIVFNSFSIVQNSILTATLNIKSLAIINICTQIPMGIISVFFAYKGFGVWTLIIQQVGISFLKTILLWIISRWRPSLCFDKESFRYLCDFGWKLLGTNLLGTFFNEIYGFVIGRFIGASELGLYSNSKSLASYPNNLISNIINRVVLPVMVESQGDRRSIRNVYIKMIEILCFISFPIFGILIVIAHPLIITLWTEKWAGTIVLFQIFCIGCALSPLSSLNSILLQLLNRTDIMLKLELIKKPICFALLLVSFPLGLKGIVVFAVIYNFIGTIINMYSTRKLLEYSCLNQCADVAKYLMAIIIAVIIAFVAIISIDNDWLRIVCGALFTLISYVTICALFKMRGFTNTVKILC